MPEELTRRIAAIWPIATCKWNVIRAGHVLFRLGSRNFAVGVMHLASFSR